MRTRLTSSRRRTTAIAGIAGLGLAISLSACGSSNMTDSGKSADSGAIMSHSTMATAGAHNDADVTFATEMITHHKQALAMVDLTQGRTLAPAVQTLADDIRAAQTPEIQTMTGWLSDWDMTSPSGSPSHDMGSMGATGSMSTASASADSMGEMGSSSMPGMMSDVDMTALKNASDADFQKMWLQMMVKHHQGAVQMARTERTDGRYQPAIDLAGQIIASQSKEIATMKRLLTSK